jgi:hypothetical protein
MRALVLMMSAGLLTACGVVGSPVPPEYVGVAPTIDKQKRLQTLEAERQPAELSEPVPVGSHDIDLPASQPVGMR